MSSSASGSPTGEGARKNRTWHTLSGQKHLLAVAHTVTYAKRLLEVLKLVETDFRIQTHFTVPPHVFGGQVPAFLAELGIEVLPWAEATRRPFDLALAAGPRGVHEVQAPLVALPHGAAYVKRLTGYGPHEDGIAGLRRRDIMPDGRTLPAALVVSHAADLHELAQSCPEALPVARVVGDPVYDRIAAALPRRAAHREALGLDEDQELLVFVSTWGPNSSFGRIENLLPRLAAELDPTRFRTAVLLHPNVYAGHGRWQVAGWLSLSARRGTAVVPPEADWRSVLIAADYVLGDHGSVTTYATLTNAPILLASSPQQEINPASPAATLALTAPTLSPGHPLEEQLGFAAREYRREEYAAIASRITSHPGEFNRRMRDVLYAQLGLGRPAYEPETVPLPLPPRLPGPPGLDGPGAWGLMSA
ncbi:hypothetical protein HUT18_15560 [Streptomyces sp. NA04227]|uniref:hypothetical protein n=1 Tax=Streptomyces sp. NA04227 TaxID=2742136 RepID=UPI0015926465|nr:hypothetical protein [Streptomyces sp. NA04227]QKW07583.1 hypothetical protein HUT18_15560 [Streptomyces sp. NA04227]